MNILVVEDDEFKFSQSNDTLNRFVDNPSISWIKSKSNVLLSIIKSNVKNEFDPYDMVITDNFLPFEEDDMAIEPFAEDIIFEIRRLGLEELPIVVCSSEDIEECGFNYKVKYDPSVSMDEIFKVIISDIKAKKHVKSL